MTNIDSRVPSRRSRSQDHHGAVSLL